MFGIIIGIRDILFILRKLMIIENLNKANLTKFSDSQ